MYLYSPPSLGSLHYLLHTSHLYITQSLDSIYPEYSQFAYGHYIISLYTYIYIFVPNSFISLNSSPLKYLDILTKSYSLLQLLVPHPILILLTLLLYLNYYSHHCNIQFLQNIQPHSNTISDYSKHI